MEGVEDFFELDYVIIEGLFGGFVHVLIFLVKLFHESAHSVSSHGVVLVAILTVHNDWVVELIENVTHYKHDLVHVLLLRLEDSIEYFADKGLFEVEKVDVF